MNNTLSKIIIFATGSAIGSVVTWKIVRDKYEQIAREEIQSIRDLYARDSEGESYAKTDVEDTNEPSDALQTEYANIIEKSNYKTYSKTEKEKEEKEEEDIMVKPYLIDQDEWDDSDYLQETLYCFEDGIITDEMENVLDDAEDLVGDEAVEWLQESGKDYIYVRNDNTETDYEILRDCRRYSEVD